MITFRKHAEGITRRFDSRLIRRPRAARALPRIAVLLGVVLAVAATAQASARHDEQSAAAPKAADAIEVPVKVYVAGTPEDPYIVARIGDFPEDLGELGKEFLKREFLEHFIRDVMGLGEGRRAEALKLALLPQEDAREQECSFTFGEVSGHIAVRLAPRHVFILVSLDREQTPTPTLRAALEKSAR